jgi:tetratricopeptide (TPR) repeat protein
MMELLLQAEGALSVGLLDRAETLYRQVSAADPRNAIAIVGLSRVALERGNQPAALELARRALALDPENVAAQRMVQRLEEVLAFQGVDISPAPATPAEPSPLPSAGSDPSGASADGSEASLPAESGPTDRRSLVDRLLRRR